MQFCQPHWDALRAAISARGLDDLIAPDGETAVAQAFDQIQRGLQGQEPSTPVNYDPLMAAHWTIVQNVAEHAQRSGGSALHVLMGDHCPLCLANEQHQLACEDPECEFSYDDWVERAADDQLAFVQTLRDQP